MAVAINPSPIGDEGNDAAFFGRKAVGGPAIGADVAVIKPFGAGGSRSCHIGIGNALVEDGIFLVLRIVIGRLLTHGIGRIADDDADGRAALRFHRFGVLLEKAFENVVLAVFAQLEGVGEADAIVGQIFRLRAHLLKDALDVDIRNVVGQQHEFVGVNLVPVFAHHVFGADEPRLQKARDESARAGEGVEHVDVFVGEGGAKLRLQHLVHRMEDEVHTLHGGVDCAELFDGEGEGAFEELLIEVFDHRLFPLEIVDLTDVGAHRFVEVGEHGEVLVHGFRFEQVDHHLHGRGDGVVAHKLIVGKEGFEDGARDEVLREHLDALFGRDAGIEVVAEGTDKLVELGGVFSAFSSDETRNARDVFLGYFAHFGRPVFPIEAVAAFLHEFGKDVLLGGTELEGELVGNFLIGDFLRVVAVVGVARECAPSHPGASEPGQADGDFGALVSVEGDGVDVGIEMIVVRTEGIENVPHHGEGLVVVEGFFGGGAFGHDDGDDDVAIFLFVRLSATEGAHDASHALHHIDLRIARREEEHGVECRHVDPFGQTAHIGHHAAFLRIVGLFGQPGQGRIALGGAHAAIDVASLDVHHVFALFVGERFVVEGGDAGQHVFDVARGAGLVFAPNLVGEGQGAAHEARVGVPSHAFVAEDFFRKAVDHADESAGVVVVEFLGIEVFHLLHEVGGDHVFRHGEHQHFVVGEDAILHRIGEVDTIEFLAIERLVVHGTEHTIIFAGFDSGILTIKPRGGGHVEALLAANEVIVVDLDEVAFVFGRQFDARGAVGFVADHEIEDAELAARLRQKLGLRLCHHVDALIGGEDHGEPIVGAAGQELVGDRRGVGRSRESQVDDGSF